jgi:hypothetical protein
MNKARTMLLAGYGDDNAKKEIELEAERQKDEQDDGQNGSETNVKPSKSPREILVEAYNKQSK